MDAKKVLFKNIANCRNSQRFIKRQGENKIEMHVKDILDLMNMPNAGTKDDPSSKPIYATATCNFPLCKLVPSNAS